MQTGGWRKICYASGMGSGMEACRESESVVELLEQFLDSGFSQETAAKMVNSALVLKRQDGMFSTVDICAVVSSGNLAKGGRERRPPLSNEITGWEQSLPKISYGGLVQQLILTRLPESFIMEIILL